MRFESVTAHAFGPFRNRTLRLTKGMNIVHGLNESGKSSWHAALQAALCGVKAGKGPPTKQQREFERRRRPWHGSDEWKVEAVVALADGRQVELLHDLAAKNGRARDVQRAGQDYSAEILEDGSVNGALWLGLSRVSFLNTACVRQAEVLAVRDGASDLQVALQSAAATAGKDATVANALQLLNGYRAERIGTERAPKRPLRVAMARVEEANGRLDDAKEGSAEYIRRQGEIGGLERALDELQRQRQALHAWQAERLARSAEGRVRRVEELRRSLKDTVDDAELAKSVEAAIEAWQAAPSPPEALQGPDPQELDEKLRSAQEELGRAKATKPSMWRKTWGLMLGLGLLAGAGICFWMQTPVLRLVGGVCAMAGVGAVFWSLLTGKREAAKSHADEVAALERQIEGLGRQLEQRRDEDAAYLVAMERRKQARERVDRVAREVAIRQDEPQGRIEGLRGWLAERRDRRAEEERRRDKLNGEMAGQSFEEIVSEAKDKREEADRVRQGCDETRLRDAEALDAGGRLAEEQKQLQGRLEGVQGQLNNAKGALKQFADGMTSVADAQDAREDASRRLHHLRALDRTLETTEEFFQSAQTNVYRRLAGVLRDTLLEWLPKVTAGRYGDCRVDPETLLVEVREAQGDWRDAGLLSHGTAEQVYLLLRLALCRHLVKEHESCPLILDDPVSASDTHRQTSVLETLLAISEETQVILFTHDDDVRDWGRIHLSQENDSQVLEIQNDTTNEPAANRLDAPAGAELGAAH